MSIVVIPTYPHNPSSSLDKFYFSFGSRLIIFWLRSCVRGFSITTQKKTEGSLFFS